MFSRGGFFFFVIAKALGPIRRGFTNDPALSLCSLIDTGGAPAAGVLAVREAHLETLLAHLSFTFSHANVHQSP